MSSNFLKGVIISLLVLLIGMVAVLGYVFLNVLNLENFDNSTQNTPKYSVKQYSDTNTVTQGLTVKSEISECIDAHTAEYLLSFGEMIKNIDIDTYIDFNDTQALMAFGDYSIPDREYYSEKGKHYNSLIKKPELGKYSSEEYNTLYRQYITDVTCTSIWNSMSIYCIQYSMYRYQLADYIDARNKNTEIQEKYKDEVIATLKGLKETKNKIMSNFVGYSDIKKSEDEIFTLNEKVDDLIKSDILGNWIWEGNGRYIKLIIGDNNLDFILGNKDSGDTHRLYGSYTINDTTMQLYDIKIANGLETMPMEIIIDTYGNFTYKFDKDKQVLYIDLPESAEKDIPLTRNKTN